MTTRVLSHVLLAAIGLIVGTVGAIAHRSEPYWGLTLSLIMVLAASVYARSWLSWGGLGAFALLWISATMMFLSIGPGVSVLIVDDALGKTWLYGGAAAIVVACLLPRNLLLDAEDVAR